MRSATSGAFASPAHSAGDFVVPARLSPTDSAHHGRSRSPLRTSTPGGKFTISPLHHTIWLALTAGLGVLAGCGDGSSLVAPKNVSPCNGGLVSLGVLQAAKLDCSAGGTSFALDGNGASYLVAPQFATSGVANQPVSYRLMASNAVVAAIMPRGNPPGLTAAPSPAGQLTMPLRKGFTPGARQREFDAALLRRNRRAVARGGVLIKSAAVPVPPLGSVQDFHVVTSNTFPPMTKRVTARLDFIGQNLLLYDDTLTPPGGFTAGELTSFGQLFDQTLDPLDIGAFGNPTDIDQNGHVIMLLSPAVNALTPASQCSTQGFIAGFFDGYDLVGTDTNSNHGEIFYGVAPDPNGQFSCAHPVSEVTADLPSVFLHELEHLINFGQHVIVSNGTPEEGWLDEGLGLVAEELGAIYYEQKFPPPTGRTNPSQLFPDSANGFISPQIASSYSYLLRPDTVTLTLHSDADPGVTWRGGDWLLLRWLGDQEGSGFYKKLVETPLTGTTNISTAAGESFESLFGDFSLALYTDSIPGQPKSAIPPRDRFVTRTLRVLYGAYFNTAGPSPTVPLPFPIVPTPLAGTVSASMVPGTTTFYQLTTASGSGTVQLQFTAPSGSAISGNLHPQVSVFRLPAP